MTYSVTCNACGELGSYDDPGFAQSVADDHNQNNPGHFATVTGAADPSAGTGPFGGYDPSGGDDPSAGDPSGGTDPSAGYDPSQAYDPALHFDPSASYDPSAGHDPSPAWDPALLLYDPAAADGAKDKPPEGGADGS